MSDKFTITGDVIARAKKYMPLDDKAAIAQSIAELCVVPMRTAKENEIGNGIFALPPLYTEDGVIKRKCLLNVFLSYYFDVELDEVTSNVYDLFGESQIFNQLERMKTSPAVRDGVFDILTDYRELKGMVDAQIFAKIRNANDPLARIAAAIAVSLTPERVSELGEQIKSLQKEISGTKEEMENG